MEITYKISEKKNIIMGSIIQRPILWMKKHQNLVKK